MSNRYPYIDFDLPTNHLAQDDPRHYVPPKARDSHEADRRRTLRSGDVLLEQQQKGLLIASAVLQRTINASDYTRAFTFGTLGASLLNSAWYTYGRGSSVMRRRLKLPQLVDEDAQSVMTPDDLRHEAISTMQTADGLMNRLREPLPAREHHRASIRLGQAFGTAALRLTSGIIALSPRESAAFAQWQSRQVAQQSLLQAREAAHEIGAHASVAQLADLDSPLAVHWRREAPDAAYEAYVEAAETYALTANCFVDKTQPIIK